MKAFQILPMMNHRYRTIGVVLAAMTFILLVLKEAHLNIFMMSLEQFILIISIGLFIMAFTKEKNETPIVEKVRYNSFKITFGLLMSVLISLSITTQFSNLQLQTVNIIFLIFPALLGYNIIYYFLRMMMIEK
jgi:hypothetical protein